MQKLLSSLLILVSLALIVSVGVDAYAIQHRQTQAFIDGRFSVFYDCYATGLSQQGSSVLICQFGKMFKPKPQRPKPKEDDDNSPPFDRNPNVEPEEGPNSDAPVKL